MHQPLGRDVEEVETALAETPPDPLALFGRDVGIETRGLDPQLLQPRHLVGHQRDQWGDDDAETRTEHRGDLIAKALAATGGQDRHGASAREEFADHPRLQAAELCMAEGVAKDLARRI